MSAAAEQLRSKFDAPGTDTDSCTGPDVASAVAMPAPGALIERVSGTAAMSTLGLPWPDFEGYVIFLPTAIFTWVTGGAAATTLAAPFALAGSAVVGKALHFVFLRLTGLWYPSYIA
jgi:hypothetical protein